MRADTFRHALPAPGASIEPLHRNLHRITMTIDRHVLAGLAVSLSLAATPCLAASSTSSAVSDSVGASVGSVSGSLQRSSDSSRTTTVADGDYRVVEVAAVADRPGQLRLTLQAVAADAAADAGFFLVLPAEVVERSRLGTGAVVSARQRPYGVEFAQGPQRQAFFLVLADDWYRELQTRAVTL